MADKQLEEDDPFAIVGVRLPEVMDDEALTTMACCFVEELARLGFGRERLLTVFRNPFYTGPHTVYRLKGEAFVRALADQIPARAGERRRG
ncbi:MAG: hypothetical protein Q7T33_03655 [Dehalococcoidia bacterium]|nr:hypothetical protein [Dehalococcoidia bacterium]